MSDRELLFHTLRMYIIEGDLSASEVQAGLMSLDALTFMGENKFIWEDTRQKMIDFLVHQSLG